MKTFTRALIIFVALAAKQPLFGQVPIMNSCEGAGPTVYLEFGGTDVVATAWNSKGNIKAKPAGLNEIAVREIFARISQDFYPFMLNITTDSNRYRQAPNFQRIKLIFTPLPAGFDNASGASFVGSFSWGDNTPAWVFTDLLGYNPAYIAAAASHEIGHSFGLQHQSLYDEQGQKISELHGGSGSGCMSWSPIMGVSLYKNLHCWFVGSSGMAGSAIQNDLNIITSAPNNISFRKDDYPNSCAKAFPLAVYNGAFSMMGVMNEAKDKDVFILNIGSAQRLRLKALACIGQTKLKLVLLNQKMELVSSYIAQNNEAIIIDRYLQTGKYFIRVEAESPVAHAEPALYAFIGGLESPESYHRVVNSKTASEFPLAVSQ